MPGFDESFPDIIKGRSLIKKNTEVTTDLDSIRLNKNTVLHSICPPEGVPPQKEGLRKLLPTNGSSTSTSASYYQTLTSYMPFGIPTKKI